MIKFNHVYPMKPRKWTIESLKNAAKSSYSFRQVIQKLGLIPAGGNYDQVKHYIKLHKIDISHFKGQAWNKGVKGLTFPRKKLRDILKKNTNFQSFKLKKRLFLEGLKEQKCEECGWCKKSTDGRIPVELDHINGDRYDNRLKNLRILCPNCHSLKTTHRGKNKRKS